MNSQTATSSGLCLLFKMTARNQQKFLLYLPPLSPPKICLSFLPFRVKVSQRFQGFSLDLHRYPNCGGVWKMKKWSLWLCCIAAASGSRGLSNTVIILPAFSHKSSEQHLWQYPQWQAVSAVSPLHGRQQLKISLAIRHEPCNCPCGNSNIFELQFLLCRINCPKNEMGQISPLSGYPSMSTHSKVWVSPTPSFLYKTLV